MADKKILPVTVLTGFLGAGKTTLLKNILEQPHGYKFGVIINEVGAISIDDRLVSVEDGELVQLANGCVCCTVRLDLAKAIHRMAESGSFDSIIIETTGVADPGPIIQTFQNIPELRRLAQLDSFVTVADAEHLASQLASEEVARNQIAMADFVLLNKIDLVTPSQIAALITEIQKHNPFCEILQTTNAAIDWKRILDIHAFDITKRLEVDPTLLDEMRKTSHAEINSHSFTFKKPFHLERFQTFMETVSKNLSIYRSKGILNIDGFRRKAIFHGVNNRFTVVWAAEWPKKDPRLSEMVFIGRDLDVNFLEKGLLGCLIS